MSVFLDPSLSAHETATAFSGEIEGYLLDDIVFSRAQASQQKFDRASAKIARDGLDHYMIELFFEGHTEMTVGRRVLRNRPGQIVGFDLGDVMDSFNSVFDVLCVFVPRARLSPLLARPDSINGVMPSVEDGPGFLLAKYLRTLYQVAPTLTPAEGATAARALLELTASAFNKASAGARADDIVAQPSQLLRAQFYIRENLASADLTSERIALGVGISRTALYKLFEPAGGVANYVRELRLRKCFRDLASSRHSGAQIAEIAYRWGFSDPAVFARAFRRRFGRSPSEAREVTHTYVRRDRQAIDPRAGNRLHEEWIATLA